MFNVHTDSRGRKGSLHLVTLVLLVEVFTPQTGFFPLRHLVVRFLDDLLAGVDSVGNQTLRNIRLSHPRDCTLPDRMRRE